MGRQLEDLSGKRFGNLIVQERVVAAGGTAWLCRCSCGRQKIVLALNLKTGRTRGCGRGCKNNNRLARSS